LGIKPKLLTSKEIEMKVFNKENFSWDGMYLMYEGDLGKFNKSYSEVYGDKCHPSRADMIVPAFIARFKYGPKPYKSWINFIAKNFDVEEWIELAENGVSPAAAMRSKGYVNSIERKLMKKHGLKVSAENIDLAFELALPN